MNKTSFRLLVLCSALVFAFPFLAFGGAFNVAPIEYKGAYQPGTEEWLLTNRMYIKLVEGWGDVQDTSSAAAARRMSLNGARTRGQPFRFSSVKSTSTTTESKERIG